MLDDEMLVVFLLYYQVLLDYRMAPLVLISRCGCSDRIVFPPSRACGPARARSTRSIFLFVFLEFLDQGKMLRCGQILNTTVFCTVEYRY